MIMKSQKGGSKNDDVRRAGVGSIKALPTKAGVWKSVDDKYE